jgi:hypothetical protein
MLKSISRHIGLLLTACVLASIFSGCGAYVGVADSDNYRPRSYYWDDPRWIGPRYPYNGEWYGDYVYYRGRWYLYGQGTPYYDPWGWNW